MTVPILIDVDAGTDDAVAIMLLISMASKTTFEIKGITCVNGNTNVDNVIRNVFITLESMNRYDIPVYRGAESALVNVFNSSDKFHGEDGFGDKELNNPMIRVQEENAIVAINRIAQENKGLVMICVGPLTNLALALKTYSNLKHNLGSIWIMGGNINGVGNVEGSTAEFNFAADPEAAHIVLSEVQSEVTILPWEPTMTTPLSTEWRFNTIGSILTKHMNLLQIIEKDQYKAQAFWNPCDALLVAAFINNSVIESSRHVDLRVELHGSFTRGQCVILSGTPKIRVIEKLNYGIIEEMITELANYGTSNNTGTI